MRSPVRAMLLLASLGGALHAQPEAPRVRLTEELRLDAVAEDFPTVTNIFVGPRRQVVVPINADMQLRVYDATGRQLGVFGRRGSGPGEFQSMAPIGWIGDTLWVADVRQQRTVFIGPDLKHIRTVQWPTIGQVGRDTLGFYTPHAFMPDGATLGRAIVTSDRKDPSSPEQMVVHRSAAGNIRIVFALPVYWGAPWTLEVNGLGRNLPFALRPQLAYHADGSRLAQLTATIPSGPNGTFSVLHLGGTGDTVFNRQYPFRASPIPKVAQDSGIASLVSSRGAGREVEAAPLDRQFQALARERMPQWYTAVETITLGLDRTTWIGLRPTNEGRGYLVLNSRGDPVGSVIVPVTTRVRQATATHIWVTETDDDGLSSVVRYRLTGLTCTPATC